MTKAIIFDLDGTLVDSCGICITILEHMLVDRGSDNAIDHDHARSFMSRGGEKMVAALLGEACIDPAKDIAEFRSRYAGTVTPPSSLFPGVAKGLETLTDLGFELAICSNKPQQLCEKVLIDTGIGAHFGHVVGHRPEFQPKPAPDLLAYTVGALKLAERECVYVGDSELDHAVAKLVGMDFYFLTYGYAEVGWLPDSGSCFDDFAALSGSLAGLRATVAA